MDIYHTILRPIITEKSTHQSGGAASQGGGGAYTFEVHLEASKPQIRDAVEKIYGVKVVEVRTQVRQSRTRRFRYGLTPPHKSKKAVVVLDKNSHIDLF